MKLEKQEEWTHMPYTLSYRQQGGHKSKSKILWTFDNIGFSSES